MKTKLFFFLLAGAICFSACKQSHDEFATSSDGLQISYTDQGSGDIALVGGDTYQQFRDTTFTGKIFEGYTAPFYQDFKTSTYGFVRAMFHENAFTQFLLINHFLGCKDFSSPGYEFNISYLTPFAKCYPRWPLFNLSIQKAY
ncbi:MAG: hypothetical protein K9H16_14610 [Bacteroidales bacterium]|nr:hypothetical protein [Bacteroidales bacterium]